MPHSSNHCTGWTGDKTQHLTILCWVCSMEIIKNMHCKGKEYRFRHVLCWKYFRVLLNYRWLNDLQNPAKITACTKQFITWHCPLTRRLFQSFSSSCLMKLISLASLDRLCCQTLPLGWVPPCIPSEGTSQSGSEGVPCPRLGVVLWSNRKPEKVKWSAVIIWILWYKYC